jgi:MFS family permease
MDTGKLELEEVIADLRLIKEAVSKSDNFFRFIDTRRAMRGVMLATGLMIAFFSGLYYYLTSIYGSFMAMPLNLRIVFYVLVGIGWIVLGLIKAGGFLKSGRAVSKDMNLNKLFNEIYTSRMLALMLPYILVIILVVIFLCNMGQFIYITPGLAILFGLLFIAMSPIIYFKELYLLSAWLIATGLLTLFSATVIHPMATLGLTFGAGFILAGLLLYLEFPGHRS